MEGHFAVISRLDVSSHPLSPATRIESLPLPLVSLAETLGSLPTSSGRLSETWERLSPGSEKLGGEPERPVQSSGRLQVNSMGLRVRPREFPNANAASSVELRR